jgi:hypothetical protein
MFCQKCGKENTDGATFCNFCGTDMKGIPAAQPTPAKPVSFHPDPYAIVFGILIIVLMYNLPLIPTKILGLDSVRVTLVEYSSMCSNSPNNLGCFPIVQYLWYGGLIFGICVIAWGLFQRN